MRISFQGQSCLCIETDVGPRIAVPIHYNMFPLIKQDPNDFLSLLDDGVGLTMQPGDFISLQ